jgi:putative phosphoserine phosphatase / 1-acylglycerol-3-phosphate O-acyltransferase
MTLHAELTREVDEGPAGPQIAAFFDLDRTLLAGFSAVHFFREDILAGRMSPKHFAQTMMIATLFQLRQVGFSGFVASTMERLRGVPESEFVTHAEHMFVEHLAADVYPEARALVQAHRRKGHTIAIVSSATRYQIDPLARDFGIEHVLCTQLEVKNGKFTGKVIEPTCYGEGKATAARKFGKPRGIDFGESYFYTDSDEDLPLLEIVGKPRPTNPSSRLAEIAAKRGWPANRFTSRGTPGALEVVRTSLAIGALFPSLMLGVPAAVLGWSWRRAVNIAITTWGEVGTALAGLDVSVEGEEHLWSHRPAVFIFNHQSGVDMLLLCRLLRRDIIAVAKQEVRQNPIFGPFFAAAGTVFIDRFNHDKAVAALKPVVESIQQGLSLVLAPEGTRSPTPHIGRFKKGAFHMAMAAGVPIVPIVLRNALDALPKHAYIVRPTTIEVVVHPPIPTADWKPEDLDRHIEEIRQLYLDTLGE